mgnify:CR=1 FL=1
MIQTSPRQTLTVVVPAYNEAAVLAQFHARLAAVFDGLDMDASVLYVDDGSRDATWQVIGELARADASQLELQRLADDFLKPWLLANAPVRAYKSCIFKTFGRTESQVATFLNGLPRDPRMHVAYRAHFPEIQVSLHVDEADADEAERLLLASATIVREQLADIVFSERADEGLVEVVAL